jgi:hypothetical protein
MFRQLCNLGLDIVLQLLGGLRVVVRDIINDCEKIGTGSFPPFKYGRGASCRSTLVRHA